jgi:hypothetical protein
MILNITGKLNPNSALIPLNLSKVLFIVVHHIDAVTATWEDINLWHKQNGWPCAGYNEYIRKDGTVYILRGDNIGAQTANMNSKSYGIALEGNYDKETSVPDAQLQSLTERIRFHKSRLPNLQKIVPHKYFGGTLCPGKYFPFDKLLLDIDNIDTTLASAVSKLNKAGIISSPDYWLSNALPTKMCIGEYVRKLIINVSNKIL